MSRYDRFWNAYPVSIPSPTPEQIAAKTVVKHLKYDAFSGASPGYEEIHFADGTILGVVSHPPITLQ